MASSCPTTSTPRRQTLFRHACAMGLEASSPSGAIGPIVRALAGLDQGEEPGRAGRDEGDRGMRLDRRRKLPIKSSVGKHSISSMAVTVA